MMTKAKLAAFQMTFPVLLLACLAAVTEALPGNPSNNPKTEFSADKSGSPNRSKRMDDLAQLGRSSTADDPPRYPGSAENNDVESESVDRFHGYNDQDMIVGQGGHININSLTPEALRMLRVGRDDSSFADSTSDVARESPLFPGFSADKSGSQSRSKRMDDFAQLGRSGTADDPPRYPGSAENHDVESESVKRLHDYDGLDMISVLGYPSHIDKNTLRRFMRFGRDVSSFADLSSDAAEEPPMFEEYAKNNDVKSEYDKQLNDDDDLDNSPGQILVDGKWNKRDSFLRIRRDDSSLGDLPSDAAENNQRASREIRN